MKLTKAILVASMLSAAWAVPAFSAPGGASSGTGESMRAAPGTAEYEFGRGVSIATPKVEDEATRAAPMTDETKAVEAFTVVTKNADGTETRSVATEEMRALILGTAPAGGEAIENADDPALTEGEEANRQVIGNDDRVQIKNTKVYPFTAIGYVEGKSKSGYGGCSGTLIGPRTVLTAAHCLYNHEDGGWLTDIIFAPGLASFQDAPFGAFQYESASILQGYVTQYQGYYGSVLNWDLGIITLAEPIGDSLGWLGYRHIDQLGEFNANVVGYPADKGNGTMWRSTCSVSSENIGADLMTYDCDTFSGSSGSAVYAYDSKTKERFALGVNIADTPDENIVLRLNAANVAWINGLWK